MASVSIKSIRKLLNDSIAAQAEWNARQNEKWEKEKEDWKNRMEESKKEWDRRMVESKKEWDRRMKRLDRDMGKLGNSYGEQVEAMFVNLGAKFNEIGFKFPKEAGRTQYLDENRIVLAEVDHLLENGSVILPVEIKARLSEEHVDNHIKRLRIISSLCAKLGDNRKVLGAVAGGIVPENVLKYAQSKGLYVLIQNGESVEIADSPAGFEVREW